MDKRPKLKAVALHPEDRVFARVEAARRDILPADIVAEAFHIYRAAIAPPKPDGSHRKALLDAIANVEIRQEGGHLSSSGLPEVTTPDPEAVEHPHPSAV